MMNRSRCLYGIHMANMLVVGTFLSVQLSHAEQKFCNDEFTGNVGNGYHYELWTDGAKGSVCMTVYGQDAKFKAEWKGVNNCVIRVGLKYDESKTPEQLGEFSADYAFSKSGLEGLALMGIYGWNVNPLVEYYIIEDWNGSLPGFQKKGTFNIDGSDYDILTNVQKNRPSIKGTATFTQWWSVRKNRRQSGHISVSKHFDEWKKVGAKLGGLYEVKLKAEGYKGSGTVDYTTAIVQLHKQVDIAFKPPVSKKNRISLNTTNYNAAIMLNGSVIDVSRHERIYKNGKIDNRTSRLYLDYFKGTDSSGVKRVLHVK